MARFLIGFLLAATQFLAPILGKDQAVLCMHPDGSALVESGEELIKCHSSTAETEDGILSAPQCRDFAIPAHATGQQIVTPRGSNFLQPQLFVAPFVSSSLDAVFAPVSRCIDPRTTTLLAHNPLESLSTVVLLT
jgi:hypothetical protein